MTHDRRKSADQNLTRIQARDAAGLELLIPHAINRQLLPSEDNDRKLAADARIGKRVLRVNTRGVAGCGTRSNRSLAFALPWRFYDETNYGDR
jgi:hypothetical protein